MITVSLMHLPCHSIDPVSPPCFAVAPLTHQLPICVFSEAKQVKILILLGKLLGSRMEEGSSGRRNLLQMYVNKS